MDSNLELCHQIVFLAQEYPKKKITELAGLVQASPLDVNCAIWRAQDEGYLKVDPKKGTVKLLKTPDKWAFGSGVDHLTKVIPYVFEKLAEDEADMTEEYFMSWAAGYAAQDLIIAMKQLIDGGIMASYDIKDVDDRHGKKEVNTYTFYTLAENKGKRWGTKQFKDKKKLK